MFASIAAARGGHEVLVFEKNEKLGKKLFITGKGRCNITNACDMDILFSSVVSNSKFLYSRFFTDIATRMSSISLKNWAFGLRLSAARGCSPRQSHSF